MKNVKKTYDSLCPVRNILDRIGDKWSILILIMIKQHELLRFGELAREIPDISQKMLTVTLRTLETDGLISRKIYPEIPPKVEYRLTGLGLSLIPYIEALTEWAKKSMGEIISNREAASKIAIKENE